MQQGNGCRPAGSIGVLRLCAGGYVCRVPAGNGCRVPAGAIDALRLCAGALWVQHGNGCSRPAGAIRVLVALCWWLWVQGASRGTDAGQRWLSIITNSLSYLFI